MALEVSLQWRHNGHDSVSNHQPHDCFLNRLFRHRSKKTSKLHVTGLCTGTSSEAGEFPAKWPVTRKMFPFDDVTMITSDIEYCDGGAPSIPPEPTWFISISVWIILYEYKFYKLGLASGNLLLHIHVCIFTVNLLRKRTRPRAIYDWRKELTDTNLPSFCHSASETTWQHFSCQIARIYRF